MAMIEFEDHTEENQEAVLAYLASENLQGPTTGHVKPILEFATRLLLTPIRLVFGRYRE
jgi:hypothetical protein